MATSAAFWQELKDLRDEYRKRYNINDNIEEKERLWMAFQAQTANYVAVEIYYRAQVLYYFALKKSGTDLSSAQSLKNALEGVEDAQRALDEDQIDLGNFRTGLEDLARFRANERTGRKYGRTQRLLSCNSRSGYTT